MKLIPMTDFVLKKYTEWVFDDNLDLNSSARYISSTQKYANFLKQPLTLGMFVPCDDNGNVLEEPKSDNYNEETRDYYYAVINYSNAKSKVLFNGFYIQNFTVRNISGDYIIYYKGKNKMSDLNIDDLISYNLDLSVSF